MLKGEAVDRGDSEISDDEKARLMELVRAYISDTSEEATLAVSEYGKIKATFKIFKQLVLEGSMSKGAGGGDGVGSVALPGGAVIGGGGSDVASGDLDTLRLQLQQRDNEINILVAMLNKRQAGGGDGNSGGGGAGTPTGSSSGGSAHADRVASLSARAQQKHGGGGTPTGGAPGGGARPVGTPKEEEPAVKLHMLDGSAERKFTRNQLNDRAVSI